MKYIIDDEIGQALRKHPVSIRIGELLVELGHISVSELKSALGIRAEEKSKRKHREILIERRFIEERVWVEALSLQLGVPFVRPEWETIDRMMNCRAACRACSPRGQWWTQGA